MNKIYIVNILDWHNYETVVVSIHPTYEIAEHYMNQYSENHKKFGRPEQKFEIVEVDLDSSKDTIYDSTERDEEVFGDS